MIALERRIYVTLEDAGPENACSEDKHCVRLNNLCELGAWCFTGEAMTLGLPCLSWRVAV
jgi:hypothetical protein